MLKTGLDGFVDRMQETSANRKSPLEPVGHEIGHILCVWVWQHFDNNHLQTSLYYNYDMTLLLPKSTKLRHNYVWLHWEKKYISMKQAVNNEMG